MGKAADVNQTDETGEAKLSITHEMETIKVKQELTHTETGCQN